MCCLYSRHIILFNNRHMLRPMLETNGWWMHMILAENDGQIIPGDKCCQNFLTLSYNWVKTPEKPQLGNWHDQELKPGPLDERDIASFPIDLCGDRKCYFIWHEDIYSFKKQQLPPNENNLQNVICFILFLLIECLQVRLFSIFVFDFSKKYHSSTAILSFYWTIGIKQTKMLLLSVEAKMLCLEANLIWAKALLPKAALLDWCAPGLRTSWPLFSDEDSKWHSMLSAWSRSMRHWGAEMVSSWNYIQAQKEFTTSPKKCSNGTINTCIQRWFFLYHLRDLKTCVLLSDLWMLEFFW